MARVLTSGFELNDTVGTVASNPDGQLAGTAAATIVNSPVRSGGFSAKYNSGAGNATSLVAWAVAFSASTSYFFRAYMLFSNLTTGTGITLVTLGSQAAAGGSIRMNSDGTLILVHNEGAAQVGSASGALIADGATWHRIELKMTLDGSSHVTGLEGVLDGTVFASGTVTGTVVPGAIQRVGWVVAPGASVVCYADDVAMNDSTGAAQNTYPGEGQIVLVKPTATSAAGTGWVLGNNTAEGGNGWNSVDNRPPVGIADLGGAGADSGQIRNATSSANSNFDTTMTTYAAAGVPFGAIVNVVDPITATGAPVVTSAKQGTVGVVSNPAITNIALAAGGTSGAFWSGVTQATYPTGWKWSHGTTTYTPAVTLATAPVMRVTQVTSSTRIASVCFMGMYVEYAAPVTSLHPPGELALQAVNRAANF